MQSMLQKIRTNLLFFLELQLLISIVILPILISWGLSISIMSIVGNLVFTYFLTAFIFVATLLFTTDLLGIPNYYVAQLLEWVTFAWHYCLDFASPAWLVGIASPIFIISFICAVLACGLYYYKINDMRQKFAWLIILFFVPYIAHAWYSRRPLHTTLQHGYGTIHLLKHNNRVYAFDYGALGARPCNQSWIEYTLTSGMVKGLGATHIDTLIIYKVNSRIPQSIQDLQDYIPVGKILYAHPADNKTE